MIEPNELRIGNWAWMKESPEWEQKQFLAITPWIALKEWYKPILLTPEILEKCGFIERNDSFEIEVFPHNKLQWDQDNECVVLVDENWQVWYSFDNSKKHLHQLQNMYFAFTEKEIEYKP